MKEFKTLNEQIVNKEVEMLQNSSYDLMNFVASPYFTITILLRCCGTSARYYGINIFTTIMEWIIPFVNWTRVAE